MLFLVLFSLVLYLSTKGFDVNKIINQHKNNPKVIERQNKRVERKQKRIERKELEQEVLDKYSNKMSNLELMRARGNRGPAGGRMFGEKAKDKKGTLKRLVKYLSFNKKYLIAIFAIVILSSAASLISPVLQGNAIDSIVVSSDLEFKLDENGNLLANNSKVETKYNGSSSDIIFSDMKISINEDYYFVINGETTEFLAYSADDKSKDLEFVIDVNQNGYLVINNKLTNYRLYQSVNNSSIEELKIKVGENNKWEINGKTIGYYSIGTKNPNKIVSILITMMIVYILSSIFTGISSIVSAYLSLNTVRKMRKDLFDRLVYLPIRFFDTNKHGDIMSRMTNDVDSITNTISQSISSLISSVITIIGAFAIMVYYSPLLTLLSFVSLGLTLVTTKALTKIMRKYYRVQQALIGELNAQVEEMVVGHKTVAAYGKEEDVEAKFNEISGYLRLFGFKASLFGGAMGPLMNIIGNIGYLLIVGFGALFVFLGINNLTTGLIITFTNLSRQFTRPINMIANLYSQIQSSLAAAERVFAVLDESVEVNDGTLELTEEKAVDTIEFKDVNFSYVEGEPVLKNFNLTIEPGQKIALVGATGSGKTTVVNLLMRFYEINSGKILIGGEDITNYSKESLRNAIAIVLQDTVLFKNSVKNNIKYGNLEATDEEVYRAAMLSNCDKFIELLPEQYDTVLSESGSNLSGGQRQLISIARAILADPKILILDEATSSVDTRTEKNIQDGMVQLMKNRTSLIIAHRLSTIRDADKIVVLDHGEIVEIGRHEELLEKQGIYYTLYQTQFAGNQI